MEELGIMDKTNMDFLVKVILSLGAASSKTPIPEETERRIRLRLETILPDLYDKYGNKLDIPNILECLAKSEDVMVRGFSERLEPLTRRSENEMFFTLKGILKY
ncbi:MAG: hypothetical protein ACYCSQ_00510 [bacterium]